MAKVVGVHPEAYAVDLVYLDTGARVPLVQVLSWSASSNSGAMDLPEPSPPADAYDVRATKDRDIYACVGAVGGLPVVIGFLFPQVCQMLFEDANLKVERHASDWYTSVDADGNFEASHPSGTYFRIGTDAAHRDLTGEDFDKKWAITKNTDKAVHVHLSVANAGDEVASLDISPTGVITSMGSQWNHTGPMAIDGDVEINGAVDVTGDVDVTGTVDATVDVIAGGKSGKTHTHSAVQSGGGTSGPPS